MLSICDFAMNVIEWERYRERGGTSFSFRTRESYARLSSLSYAVTSGNVSASFSLLSWPMHGTMRRGNEFTRADFLSFARSTCRSAGSTSPIHTFTSRYVASGLHAALLSLNLDSLQESVGKKLWSCQPRFTLTTFRHNNLISRYKF